MDIRKAQLSFYHLYILVKNDIASVVEDLAETNQLSKHLYGHICKYILIRTCAFYDELTKHTLPAFESGETRYQALIKVYNYIVYVRDKYFPDIFRIRNNGLAHNYRIRTEKDRSIFEEHTKYIIPITAAELSLNCNLMDEMLSAITFLYPDIKDIMDNDIHSPQFLGSSVDASNFKSIIKEVQHDVQILVDGVL